MTYILPALILLGLSALFAFLLSYLGNKLQVERDPKIDDVVRLLCGANCGGCGYGGCDAFAVALVEGKAQVSACNPTSKESKELIAKVLGMTVDASKATVAVVHCAGGNRCKNKYDYQGYGDCVSANFLAGGNKACDGGCIGFGSCVENCKYNAITVEKDRGYALVNDKNCISCGACVSVCPKKIISRIPKEAKIYIACTNTNKGKDVMSICEYGCIACGRCTKICPTNAINLDNNLAIIDYDKCIACGECVKVCPRHCIHNKDNIFAGEFNTASGG